MTDEQAQDALLRRVARESKVPADLLFRLAALEQEIPDVNIHGAKAELSRRVSAIIDEMAACEDDT